MNTHGYIGIKWEGDMLILNLTGPFNVEGAEYYANEIRESVRNWTVSTWKRLALLCPDSFGSPDVTAVMQQINYWYIENGCIASAIVSNCLIHSQLYEFNTHCTLFNQRNAAMLPQAHL